MIGNGDQHFSDSKLRMMSEIYQVNVGVKIFGCGRGRAVKGSISKKPQIAAQVQIPPAIGFFLLYLLITLFLIFFLFCFSNKNRGFYYLCLKNEKKNKKKTL